MKSLVPIFNTAEFNRVDERALNEARQSETLLITIFRSLLDDSARQARAREIATVRRREMIATHKQAEAEHAVQQRELDSKISRLAIDLSRVAIYAQEELDKYVQDALTPEPTKSKEARLLRAHALGIINLEHERVERSEETEYEASKRAVRQQDKNKCLCCNRGYEKGELHVHHVVPLYQFGTNSERNLVTLCYPCHNKQHPDFQVSRNQPIRRAPRQQRFIAVDIETTGFSNEDDIIEIGAALFVGGELAEVFQSFVHTKRQLPGVITRITGITSEHLQDAPNANVVFQAFRKFIGDSRLVFHNSSFDLRFLNRYAAYFDHPFENTVHDTLKIAREKLPLMINHKLATLVEHFDLRVKPTHRAKEDSIATGLLYLKLSALGTLPHTHKRAHQSERKVYIQSTAEADETNKPPPLTALDFGQQPPSKHSNEDAIVQNVFSETVFLAEQDDYVAQCELGAMYAKGFGVAKNYELAVQWYNQAIEQGNDDAESGLAEICREAELGDADAQEALKMFGIDWLNQTEVIDPLLPHDTALQRTKILAEKGVASEQCNLGAMYFKGCCVEQNYEQALHWHRQAAKQGNADGQCMLGLMHNEGFGVEPNYDEALYWYRESAKQGHPEAQEALKMFGIDWSGQTVETKPTMEHRATPALLLQPEITVVAKIKPFSKSKTITPKIQNIEDFAKELGLPVPLLLEHLHAAGANKVRGSDPITEQDKAQLLEHLRNKYSTSTTTTKSATKVLVAPDNIAVTTSALQLAMALAEQGNANAQTHLGAMYTDGNGVTQDYVQAMIWFHKAAAQGSAMAQYNLGTMYADGRSVPQNYAQAMMWYRIAKDGGIPLADKNLQQLEAHCTLSQITESKKMAREWQNLHIR